LFKKEDLLIALIEENVYVWIYQKGDFVYVIIKDLSDGIGE
jgi:hypothetical protein